MVMCTLGAFISIVWLREQILHGGGPDWLDFDFGVGNQVSLEIMTAFVSNRCIMFCLVIYIYISPVQNILFI